MVQYCNLKYRVRVIACAAAAARTHAPNSCDRPTKQVLLLSLQLDKTARRRSKEVTHDSPAWINVVPRRATVDVVPARTRMSSSSLAFVPRKVAGIQRKAVGKAQAASKAAKGAFTNDANAATFYPKDVLVRARLTTTLGEPPCADSIRSHVERLYSHSIDYVDIITCQDGKVNEVECVLRFPCSTMAHETVEAVRQSHGSQGAAVQCTGLRITSIELLFDKSEQERYWSGVSRRTVRRALHRHKLAVGMKRRQRAAETQGWSK